MVGIRQILLAVLFAALCAGATAATGPAKMSESELRAAFNIGADYTVGYQDENGATLTREQFMQRLKQGSMGVGAVKNPAKHTATLQITKPGQIPGVKPVTSLPPLDFHDIAGQPITGKSLAGKPTLLSFFFAECAPCVAEVPILNE